MVIGIVITPCKIIFNKIIITASTYARQLVHMLIKILGKQKLVCGKKEWSR